MDQDLPDLTETQQQIAHLERQLSGLEDAQRFAEMGDDRYYTNGRKQKDDAEIEAVRRRIADLRAGTD